MQTNKFWQGVKSAYMRYDRMMEKQGFYVVLGVCVTVILLSAFFTFRMRNDAEEIPPEAGYEEAAVAGGSQNAQTLAQAQALIASEGANAPLSVPTEPPFRLAQPVNGFTDRTFSVTEPVFFSQTGAWRVHTGIDLLTDYGAPVAAAAGGRVVAVWQDNEMGLCIRIDHGNGYQTVYAGMSSADYARAGDPVAQGQTVGHVGNGVLAESDGEPHLHFEVHHNGKAVDPLAVFLGIDN